MEKQLYVIYFESANYMGYGQHCLVWAVDEHEAESEASSYMDEVCRNQDYEQFVEENGEEAAEEAFWYSVESVELLKGSGLEKYADDPSQSEFYPVVN